MPQGTTENLMLLTKENQHKVSKLSVAKGEARRRVDEVKYAGPGGGHRRKMVDDLEEHASAAEGRFERVRGKFGVINGMLIRSDDTHTRTLRAYCARQRRAVTTTMTAATGQAAMTTTDLKGRTEKGAAAAHEHTNGEER